MALDRTARGPSSRCAATSRGKLRMNDAMARHWEEESMSRWMLGLMIGLTLAWAGANGAWAQSPDEAPAAAEEVDAEDAAGASDETGAETTGAGEPSDDDLDGEATGVASGEEVATEDAGDDEATGGLGRLGDEQADMEEQTPTERGIDNLDPTEHEDQDYFFLGAFYRHVIIPGFIQDLFVEGGIDGSNPGVGLQFLWRKNNFNVSANVWWNNANGQGYFRAQGDPVTDTEYIDAQLGVIFVNAEFMWSFPITEWFAFEFGFDLGLGFIYGDLIRTEAYETTRGSGQFQPCRGSNDPDAPSGYCEPPAPPPCYARNGGHYGCVEPNWFTEGGDTPFVFPWVSLPHVAVRFKPIRQLQVRIDGGYGLYNFFFGGGLSYGF